jgi:acyl carrier protein
VSIATVVDTAVRGHVSGRVAEIAAELGAMPAWITPASRFDELGLDSLALAELVQILEYDFDLRLFALAHGRIDTVGDAIDLVVSQLSA